jgi:hypothetical protein
MVEGTATFGRPLEMNCSMAIWAVASLTQQIYSLSALNVHLSEISASAPDPHLNLPHESGR